MTSEVIDFTRWAQHLAAIAIDVTIAATEETVMIQPSFLLRRALLADAVFSGASAVLLAAGSVPLAALMNLPTALLFEAGVFLIAYALFVGWLSRLGTLSRWLVWAVIAGNAVWTIASIALLAGGPIAPNGLGYAALVIQAIAVGVFAELQFIGLRKSGAQVAI